MKKLIILFIICYYSSLYAGGLHVDINSFPAAVSLTTFAQATAVANIYADQKGNTHYSYISAVDQDGNTKGIKMDGNKIRTVSQPYLYAVGEGEIAGHSNLVKFGFNPDIGTAQETIWSYGGDYIYPPVTGTALEVVSSSASDIVGSSTGIWGVYVQYLDTNYDEKVAYVYLSGTAAQQVGGGAPITASRINGFRAWQVDGAGKPAGNITLRRSGGGTVYSYITAGYTKARNTVYTVPRNKTYYITSVSFSATGAKYVRFTTQATYDTYLGITTKAGTLFFPFTEIFLLNGSWTKELEVPTKFPAYTDLKVNAISDGASSLCTASYAGWIE